MRRIPTLSEILAGFERGAAAGTAVILLVVVVLAVLQLAWVVVRDTVTGPILLDPREGGEIASAFLLLLLAVELVGCVRTFVRDGGVPVSSILKIAVIAVARRAFDPGALDGSAGLGLAALLVAVVGGYLAERRWAPRRGAPRVDPMDPMDPPRVPH
jgi:uncharacterized membrane protein (DUF373 family)